MVTAGRVQLAGEDIGEELQAVGSLMQALLLGVVAQAMFDPESAPTGEQLAQSLRSVADRISPSA